MRSELGAGRRLPAGRPGLITRSHRQLRHLGPDPVDRARDVEDGHLVVDRDIRRIGKARTLDPDLDGTVHPSFFDQQEKQTEQAEKEEDDG